MVRKSAQICRVFAVFCLLFACTYSFAADVVTLYPERTNLIAANDNSDTQFQIYHVDVADFKVGEVVLSTSNFIGEVLAIRDGKLFVEGRFLNGKYSPRNFVKQTQSVRGIQVGSHILDGAGEWGRLTRAWEDGRIELSGRWHSSVPFYIDKMKIVRVVPPKPRPTTIIGRLCESFMSLW